MADAAANGNAGDGRVTAALIVIGDEILSGRTKDVNIGAIADFCTEIGIELCEVRVVADEQQDIVDALNALRARYTYVFTTGGIGPTHDDITAESVAAAFGRKLIIHPDAVAAMEARWPGEPLSESRKRMARVPEGGTLIVNAVSAAPGFCVENVYVMAGVPVIMRAMLETLAGMLAVGKKIESRTVTVGLGESFVGDQLAALQAEYPDVKMGSYPQMSQGPRRFWTQLVLRSSDVARLEVATKAVSDMVDRVHAANNVVLDGELGA